MLRNLTFRRLQVDEIWSYVRCKQTNLTAKKAAAGVFGDAWVWVAIDAQTKLVPCWLVGQRDTICATQFIADLETRLSHRVQLTSNGLKLYLNAVIDAFADDIDHAVLVKVWGEDPQPQRRYSPVVSLATRTESILGDPDPKHISTSYIERQNLTMRMGMRRFTRLTNAFSKKIENHEASVALHFMHYNFARIHQTLRVTPAMEAASQINVWSLEEIVSLVDQRSVRLAA